MAGGEIMNIIYGPVPSWRFGRSLGIDPICSTEKVCSFDCKYCQLGKTKHKTLDRKPYIDLNQFKEELEAADKSKIDVMTFSGTGEPTLNSQLGQMIDFAKRFNKPVAVLTNSSLLPDPQVRKELSKADIVAAKLDAPNEELLHLINHPISKIHFKTIVDGILKFRKTFKGKLCLQMMFTFLNKDCASDMADLARKIKPDGVQLDTPLRKSSLPPLTKEEMDEIEKSFAGLPIISVYKKKKPKTSPFDIHETRLRRP
jgi:wyosine [tRNA(Phe)-imidazoG37] synthetase (radical SAM superfamily)